MKQLIKDWSSFCEGEVVFEDGYFYTLFMENISIDEIRLIYQYFPNSDELIERMEKFLFVKPVKDVVDEIKISRLEKLIRLDFEERKPILKTLDSFSIFNSNAKFNYVSEFESISKLTMDDIWSQSFHDYLRSQKIDHDKKTYELFNSLYGLTYDFDYQLFLFKPLLRTSYSMQYLYDFKQLGGVYAITENGVFFSIK